jgi:hypothetical protein
MSHCVTFDCSIVAERVDMQAGVRGEGVRACSFPRQLHKSLVTVSAKVPRLQQLCISCLALFPYCPNQNLVPCPVSCTARTRILSCAVPEYPVAKTLKLKLQLVYDLQSVGQSVLVSGTHLGPAINFSFSLKFPLDSCGFIILLRPL